MSYIQSFQGQSWLLPPNIEDLIPKDHICFLVESLIEAMDFSSFDEKYAGAGHPAYHPRILLKLLVMGVLDKVRSSRMLARNARENVVYMHIAEKLTPDFRTLSDFRKDNPDLVKATFKHTVILAKQEGLLDLSHLATDGTKIKANAANRSVLSREELAFLHDFVDGELEEWAKRDVLEDDFFGHLRGSDQLPEKSKKAIQKVVRSYVEQMKKKSPDFKKQMQAKLKRAKKELEREPKLKGVSLSDPESRFMKNKKGKIELSYNPQITVDNNGFILASDVCTQAADTNQLQPQLLQTEENLKELPQNVMWSFDNGYFESGNIKFLADKKVDAYIQIQKAKNESPYDKKNFTYSLEKDQYTCPAGQVVIFLGDHFDKSKKKMTRIYKAQGCRNCPYQKECTKTKGGIRYIKQFPFELERKAMEQKMQTELAQEVYKNRAKTVEPSFGDIKENKGIRAFLTKSLKAVKTEFNLASIAHNLRKIARLKGEKKYVLQSKPNFIFNLPFSAG